MLLTWKTDLTRNVYRWTPTREGGNANTHTINERINMHAHLDAVKLYYNLIRNFDASDV
jgi:Gly-Xaa carboxypeptidase